MAPNETKVTGVLYEKDAATPDFGIANTPVHTADNIKWVYKWHFIILFAVLHAGALYGAYLFLVSAKWQTDVFACVLHAAGVLGVTAGAHRLWSHRSYKAKWPLRLILASFHALALQYSLIFWVRTHRTHHKYSDTDADLSNASRGFFYSHIGWLFVQEHPEFVRKSQATDMSDMYNDPIARYQDKYYPVWAALACFILPTCIPVYYWNESWTNAFFVPGVFRYICTLNTAFTINSIAHLWGNKPYDKNIRPTETMTYSVLTLGEGSHNYHHTFPWDYKTNEFCTRFNFITNFIHLFAKIGWAYDMKTVSQEIIEKRANRTGDGSRHLWGWGDKNLPKDEMAAAIRINRKD